MPQKEVFHTKSFMFKQNRRPTHSFVFTDIKLFVYIYNNTSFFWQILLFYLFIWTCSNSTYHKKKLEQGQFKSETKNYIYFYETWLKDILGYDLDENILIDEKEEHGQGKSEFILKSGNKKFMVVELKDQNTNLDKPQTTKQNQRQTNTH